MKKLLNYFLEYVSLGLLFAVIGHVILVVADTRAIMSDHCYTQIQHDGLEPEESLRVCGEYMQQFTPVQIIKAVYFE